MFLFWFMILHSFWLSVYHFLCFFGERVSKFHWIFVFSYLGLSFYMGNLGIENLFVWQNRISYGFSLFQKFISTILFNRFLLSLIIRLQPDITLLFLLLITRLIITILRLFLLLTFILDTGPNIIPRLIIKQHIKISIRFNDYKITILILVFDNKKWRHFGEIVLDEFSHVLVIVSTALFERKQLGSTAMTEQDLHCFTFTFVYTVLY